MMTNLTDCYTYSDEWASRKEVEILTVGEIIRAARIAKGLTQEELGKLVGVQKSAIAKYENGRVVNIKMGKIVKIAQVLGLNGNELIESRPVTAKRIRTSAKKGSDIISDVAARLRTDSDFLCAVEWIYRLDKKKLECLLSLIR